MTDVEFLRALADDFGVAAAWGEHAATCKRLREIATKLEHSKCNCSQPAWATWDAPCPVHWDNNDD